jgi:hypothetical protein
MRKKGWNFGQRGGTAGLRSLGGDVRGWVYVVETKIIWRFYTVMLIRPRYPAHTSSFQLCSTCTTFAAQHLYESRFPRSLCGLYFLRFVARHERVDAVVLREPVCAAGWGGAALDSGWEM